MAFPDVAILDSGSGADADPAGGLWVVTFYTDSGHLKRLSSRLRGSTGSGVFNGAYYNGASGSPPYQIAWTVDPLPSPGESVWAWMWFGDPDNPTGYGVTYQHGSAGARPFNVYRADAGGQSRLGPLGHTIPGPFSLGASTLGLSFEADGSWQAYYGNDSAPTADVSGTDASPLTGPFKPAAEIQNTTAGIKNFRAGALLTTYTTSGEADLGLEVDATSSYSVSSTYTRAGEVDLGLEVDALTVVATEIAPPPPSAPEPVGTKFADVLYASLAPLDIGE